MISAPYRIAFDNSLVYNHTSFMKTGKKLKISVAIITRNRDKLLNSCLASLKKQTICPDEIVIIDNGSTDNSKNVVGAFNQTLPVRYIYELDIGIPQARNRA